MQRERSIAYVVIAILCLTLPVWAVFIMPVWVGEWADAVRLLCLSLPGLWLGVLAVRRKKRWLYVAAILWWLVFLTHSAVLASAWLIFDSSMDAYFVVQALANTTDTEVQEFLSSHLPRLLGFVVLLTLCLAVSFYGVGKWFRVCFPQRRKAETVIWGLVLLLVLAAYAVKPNRALFPAIYWANYHSKMQAFRSETEKHQAWHRTWQQHAEKNVVLKPDFAERQTQVLVLSESINAFNLSVCGYPRETSPYLSQNQSELNVFCRAYSRYPSTVSAVRSMLSDAAEGEARQSVLAAAKVAGFKIFWLSNQDDAYLSSLFGSFADQAVYRNKRSGRSSSAKDEGLLPDYQAALEDPAPRKLIILHLIGAHPNYSERYPEKFKRFPSDEVGSSEVAEQLAQAGAGFWVSELRDEYDNSVFYQDWLLSEWISRLKQQQLPHAGLLYVSDHGNEVGHERDHAGHSPGTEAGYRVPLVIWRSQGKVEEVNRDALIDTGMLTPNLLEMMGISDQSISSHSLWLDPKYRFEPPKNWPYWQASH